MVKFKKKIITIMQRAFHKLSLRKCIVFESNPDFSCNTYPVYELMKDSDLFKQYKFVWFTRDKATCKKAKCIPLNGTRLDFLRRTYYMSTAKCLISCNYLLEKLFDDQISVFLSHGSKTKVTKGICEIGDSVDYVMVQSHFFDSVIKYEYNLKDEQLAYCGYPRCDYLTKCNKNICKSFGFDDGSKYIVWLPTFRKSINRDVDDAKSNYSKLGMPIIYNIEDLIEFNDFIRHRNIYILFKAHPSQDMSSLNAQSLSNFVIINDAVLKKKGLQLYEVLSKSSALLTDYSSVFFDYLLLDRPIGTTTDDINEWKKGRGFAFDLESLYDDSTTRIPNLDTLLSFVECVDKGKDEKKIERNKIKDLTNTHKDGCSAERVVNFVYDKMINMESTK